MKLEWLSEGKGEDVLVTSRLLVLLSCSHFPTVRVNLFVFSAVDRGVRVKNHATGRCSDGCRGMPEGNEEREKPFSTTVGS